MRQLSIYDVLENGDGQAKVEPVVAGLTREQLMTPIEVAELLAVPVSTVLDWGRRGLLPRIKLGRHVRFLRASVERVLLELEARHAA